MGRNSDSRVAGLLVAGIVGALIAGGLALSSVTTDTSALDEATALHAADMALVTQDLAMSAIGQSALVAEDAGRSIAAEPDVVAAVARADAAVSRMQAGFVSLPDSVQEALASEYTDWESAAASVISSVNSGDADAALATLADSLAPAADALAAGLLAERDTRAAAVADAESGLALAARLVGFVVVFLLPLVAILIYRESARRQMHAARLHLDARMEAEAAAGKDKEQLVADLAAKLQIPLASIHEFSGLLLDGGAESERARDLISLIHGRSGELSHQLEDVLAAAGSLPPLAAETLQIADEVDAAISSFARHGYQIGGTYGAGSVEADSARVRQILRNLLTNALVHGGPKVSVFGDVAGSKYVVAVEDNGAGLPPHVVDEFTADTAPLESEAGLGLAVSRLLAKSMSGSLEYDRIAGRTAFVLSLPIAERVDDPAVGDVLIATEQ